MPSERDYKTGELVFIRSFSLPPHPENCPCSTCVRKRAWRAEQEVRILKIGLGPGEWLKKWEEHKQKHGIPDKRQPVPWDGDGMKQCPYCSFVAPSDERLAIHVRHYCLGAKAEQAQREARAAVQHKLDNFIPSRTGGLGTSIFCSEDLGVD